MKHKPTKKELLALINQIKEVLTDSIPAANIAAKKYSTEPISIVSFELGHLSGSVKTVLSHISLIIEK
ncbi:hypothetical protein EBU94_04275 [bacterium]|nr:hypothetical protein [bacterium]